MNRQLRWLTLAVLAGVALSRGTPGRAQTTLSLVGTNVVLSFPTASNQVYYIQRRDSLASGLWSTIASNIVGTGKTSTNIDAGAATLLDRFYRVGSTATGTGTVFVADKFADGTPDTNDYVYFIYSGGKTNTAGPTDNLGFLTYTKVPVGSFTVRARHPDNLDSYTDVAGTMPSNGALVSVTVYLPCLGEVDYQVYYQNSNTAGGASAILTSGSSEYGPGYTVGNGSGAFGYIPIGGFSLTAFNPHNQNSYATVRGAVPSNCATANVIIYLPTN